jgi:hypothetical protein
VEEEAPPVPGAHRVGDAGEGGVLLGRERDPRIALGQAAGHRLAPARARTRRLTRVGRVVAHEAIACQGREDLARAGKASRQAAGAERPLGERRQEVAGRAAQGAALQGCGAAGGEGDPLARPCTRARGQCRGERDAQRAEAGLRLLA